MALSLDSTNVIQYLCGRVRARQLFIMWVKFWSITDSWGKGCQARDKAIDMRHLRGSWLRVGTQLDFFFPFRDATFLTLIGIGTMVKVLIPTCSPFEVGGSVVFYSALDMKPHLTIEERVNHFALESAKPGIPTLARILAHF